MKIKSASHYVTNDVIYAMIKPAIKKDFRILDFGAGNGHMAQRIGNTAESAGIEPTSCIFPCEIVPEDFKYEKVKCTKIDTDSQIPFEENFFDIVYAIEVLEHTAKPYDFFMEAFRVLKPNGILIISVPNLMHILSRFSILFNGFATLYPPPSKKKKNAGRICGHIMPLTYSYFHYGLFIAGFDNVKFKADKKKKGCIFWAIILRPIHKFCSMIYDKNLKKYDSEVWEENAEIVHTMNSFDMLSSRSCIVSAQKIIIN